MLVKLLPDQVADYWELIRDSIDASVAPTAGEEPDRMNKILEAILAGRMICWVSTRNDDGKTEVIAIATTTILVDWCTGTKNLLFYSLYATEKTRPSDWTEGFETLAKYGKGKGCHRIIAYVKDDSPMIEITRRFDGDTSYKFASIPL